MARISVWGLAALLMLPVYAWAGDDVCERAQGQQPPQQQRGAQPDAKNGRGDQGQSSRPHWWSDPQLRQQLAITDSQSKSVEQVWQQSLPKLRDAWHRLDQLEKSLSQMIQDAADEPSVVAQIEKVEGTRVELNKGRMLMLYRMYKLLTPEQRAKVIAMYPPVDDHRDGRRGGGPR
jgi:Spy/CpxP family protein refolding chaperone